MELQLSVALQVALYAASLAMVVLAAVLVRVMLRLEKQSERVVTAVERVEAELTPLVRETRVAVDRLSDLSGSAQAAVAVAGNLLLPVRTINRAAQLLRTGVTTFLRALWSPRTETRPGTGILPS